MYDVKIVMVGGRYVGKSALFVQFEQHMFVEEYDPTIESAYHPKRVVDDETFAIEIGDSTGDAGDPCFMAMRRLFYTHGDVFVVVYSVTARSTFEDLLGFLEEISSMREVPVAELSVVIVGNKVDLEADNERVVTTTEGQAFADLYGYPFFESSAKTRVNVDEVFFECCRIKARRNPSTAAIRASKKQEKLARRQQALAAASPLPIPETKLPEYRFAPSRESLGADLLRLLANANNIAVTEADESNNLSATFYPTVPDRAVADVEFIFSSAHENDIDESSSDGSSVLAAALSTAKTGRAAALRTGQSTPSLLAHKVVLLPRCSTLMKHASEPVDILGVSRVVVSDYTSDAWLHLLAFIYSGALYSPHNDVYRERSVAQEDAIADCAARLSTTKEAHYADMMVAYTPLPWRRFRIELEAAAAEFDVPHLHNAIFAATNDVCNVASLSVMFDADFLADAEFVIGINSPDSIRIPAHSAVLLARSPVLRRLFAVESQFAASATASASSPVKSKQCDFQRVRIPIDAAECSEHTLRLAIKYFYDDGVDVLESDLLRLLSAGTESSANTGRDGVIDGLDGSSVVSELWRLARRWEVENLALCCERVIAQSLSVETVCFFAEESIPSEGSAGRPSLLASCIDFASYRLDKIVQTDAFARMSPELRTAFEQARAFGVWDDEKPAGMVAKAKRRFRLMKATLLG